MKTYTLRCEKCGWQEDRMMEKETPKVSRCPSCDEMTLVKITGVMY